MLTGGISANSGRCVFRGTQYGSSLESGPGTVRRGYGGLVFGTLLGPETTGPVSMAVGCGSGTCVSGFLAAPITRLFPFVGRVWGVWYGVVV